MNWFERKVIEELKPYKYDNSLSSKENAIKYYIEKKSSFFIIPIIIIGLISIIIKELRKGRKRNWIED